MCVCLGWVGVGVGAGIERLNQTENHLSFAAASQPHDLVSSWTTRGMFCSVRILDPAADRVHSATLACDYQPSLDNQGNDYFLSHRSNHQG